MSGAGKTISMAAAVAFSGAIAMASPASAASLFDVLFGSPRPVVYVPAYQPERVSPLPQLRGFQVVKPPRTKVHRSGGRIVLEVPDHLVRGRKAKVTLTPAEQASHLARFLADQTLRNGDVVVTPKGLYTFAGLSGLRHRASDFVPVEKSASLDRTTRNHLAAIQKANRRSQGGHVVVVAQKPAPGSSAIAGLQDKRAPEKRAQVVASDE